MKLKLQGNICREKKIVLLYFLKVTGSIIMTTNTFWVHYITVSNVIVEVWNAAVRNLIQKYKKHYQDQKNNMPIIRTWGYILHVKNLWIHSWHPCTYQTCNKNWQDYFNYKQFYSLNVHPPNFMDIDCWLSWCKLLIKTKQNARS